MTFATSALWSWVSGAVPIVSGYPSGVSGFTDSKTGLTPTDLQAFVNVPIADYSTNPPTAVASATIAEWIRDSEDYVEQQTSLLLCPTWVASPPAGNLLQARAIGFTGSGGYQVLGQDYDLPDAAYDFIFNRAQDEAWMAQPLRYRPVKSIANISYIYPLLDTFFQVPLAWQVLDQDFGLVRLVPAQNVQMLPLFAMQLSFMGFAESVPGAIWYQYTAGLTATDYSSRYRFIKQLVLAHAGIIALSNVQSTINRGAEIYKMTIDGIGYEQRFDKRGPYAGQIDRYKEMEKELLKTARDLVSGPMWLTL